MRMYNNIKISSINKQKRMSDSEEEKVSPYAAWMTCAQPWEYLEQQRKHTMFKAGECTMFKDVV